MKMVHLNEKPFSFFCSILLTWHIFREQVRENRNLRHRKALAVQAWQVGTCVSILPCSIASHMGGCSTHAQGMCGGSALHLPATCCLPRSSEGTVSSEATEVYCERSVSAPHTALFCHFCHTGFFYFEQGKNTFSPSFLVHNKEAGSWARHGSTHL